MSDDLTAPLEAWAGELLSRLDSSKRRALLLKIARAVRERQSKRIGAQKNPDDSAYEPRKRNRTRKRPGARASVGRIKRQAMFAKLRTAKWLKVEVTAEGLAVGFEGRVARIAAVHQEGQLAPVDPHGPTYRYPRRALLGFTDDDYRLIRDMLIEHMEP
ncbi:phage virion morphogenesis protein [Paraburkholderia antibiotica]|uniref:Phage virion morphogenesis protein n=1 Tax=Paraburkholderia antibiotica TaxID=2728839 RepID=A0A7X9X5G3_9BURK|nr:phage virion morphogenesis protein [Paraburkholderia antibiotica]NML31786.1 phage virion morphogenesis protein [Paraburkholderia antibiotica]